MRPSKDYSELKKVINSYIDKYPSPNIAANEKNLIELNRLQLDGKTIEAKKLRDKISLSNGGFAMRYVMKYYTILNDESVISDLFQEAMIGIIEAIDTFKTSLKTSFTTYAYFHVRKRLIDFIKKNKIVRAPRDIARNLKCVNDTLCALYTKLGRNPSIGEIRIDLAKNKKVFLKDQAIDSILLLLELNSADHTDPFMSEYIDQVSQESNHSIFKMMSINILQELEGSNEEAKKTLKMRFGIEEEFPHSINEIKVITNKAEKEIKKVKI